MKKLIRQVIIRIVAKTLFPSPFGRVGVGLLLFLLFSCDGYLEPEIVTSLTETHVTTQYTYSRGRVSAIYNDLQNGFTNVGGAMMACASDEAEFTLESSSVHTFNRGSWNQFNNPNNVWETYYRNIRRVNQFLVTSANISLDMYADRPAVKETYREEIERWLYEVRMIRAYHYFELIKRFGGIPLITRVTSIDDNFNDIPRNPLAECIQFIVDECDAASIVLPARYGSADLGRVTSVAALALKSRVLLYAASELFNNTDWAGVYAYPELISLTGDRQARWQAAANAAKAAIKLAEDNGYVLGTDYSALFGPNTHTNDEVIFSRRNGTTNNFEITNVSVGFDRGNSGTTPSQNLVDAYEMRNGSKFDWNNPAHSSNPYANRDLRLGLTVVTNNSSYKGRPAECWEGGRDGPPIFRASKTGYYLRKYVNEDLNLVADQRSVHSWVIFRLAELYLNYAEALNEAEPENSDIKIYIDKLRRRADNLPALPAGLSQSQMRERIYNERQVELAFEDHRFWDVRRWMIAPDVLSAPLKGVKITRIANDQFDYSVIDVESRVFQPKMYLYPIPQNEIYVAGKLVQNPLW